MNANIHTYVVISFYFSICLLYFILCVCVCMCVLFVLERECERRHGVGQVGRMWEMKKGKE